MDISVEIIPRVAVEDHGYETPCWIWKGAVSTAGYGTRGLPGGGPIVQTHRYEYEQAVGPIPEDHILHHLCGQKRCLRVSHLAEMTRADHNLLHDGKFDRPTAIRLYVEDGLTQVQVAARLGVSRSAVQRPLAGLRRGSGRFLDTTTLEEGSERA